MDRSFFFLEGDANVRTGQCKRKRKLNLAAQRAIGSEVWLLRGSLSDNLHFSQDAKLPHRSVSCSAYTGQRLIECFIHPACIVGRIALAGTSLNKMKKQMALRLRMDASEVPEVANSRNRIEHPLPLRLRQDDWALAHDSNQNRKCLTYCDQVRRKRGANLLSMSTQGM